jgi:UDP-N-acetylglucosamine 2-epimerase
LFQCLGEVIGKERPDWLLVQGDTTTAMAAGMAAFHEGVRVAHIEAGLRTDSMRRPFPEEMNRRVLARVSEVHFAPTARARENLMREGVTADAITVTGNTAIDAVLWAAAQPAESGPDALASANGARPLLVTTHRRESFGRPLENVCLALRELSKKYGRHIEIFFPVHLNPNVDDHVRRLLSGHANIRLLPPLSYLGLVHLMQRSYFILTDSGGIQEEAPSFGKPVLVLRETTERLEGVEAGTARVVGTDPVRIVAEASRLMDDDEAYRMMARRVNVYGDGRAAERIAAVLKAIGSDRASRATSGLSEQ